MTAKLAYLCSSESWGGLEMNHLRNAQWMQERGHQVVFVCVKGSPLDKNALTFNLRVIHIEKHKKYYDFKKGKELTKLLVNEHVSHLIIRSTYDMSITAYIKRKLGSKIHTSYFMEMQLGVKKTNLLHTLRFKGIDLWSCPLNWLSTQVCEMTRFSNKLVVIPSGIELNQFNNLPDKLISRDALNFPENKFILGLIGRFDEQKGQLLLLEAMKLCRRKDFVVSLLGEPTLHEGEDYFSKMKRMISDNDLESRVLIRQFRKDAETFYNAIDWFVMATKAETFGMVTIESLATGTPVLGSNAGGTPEILQENKGGLLFKTLDAKDLALQIDRILDEAIQYEPKILKKMALQYDHNTICERIEQELNIKS